MKDKIFVMQSQKLAIFPAVYNSTSSDPQSLVFWKKIYEGDNRELGVFLQVEGRDSDETKILGRDMWDKINGFLAKLIEERKVFSSSEEICEKIIKILNRYLLSWSHERGLDNWNDIHILVGTAAPTAVCFTRVGNAHLIFWRNRQAILADENLNGNRSPHFSSAFSEIVGGSVRLGDRFLIATPSFTESLGWDELTSLISHADVNGAFKNILRSMEVIANPLSTSFILGEVASSAYDAGKIPSVLEGKVTRGKDGGMEFLEFNSLAAAPARSSSPIVPWKEIARTGGSASGKVLGKIFKILFFPFILFAKRIAPLSTGRKAVLVGGLVGVIAFVVVLGYFSLQSSPVFQPTNYEEMYANAESLIEEANSSLIYHDDEKARKLFWQADSLLSQVIESGEWGIKAVVLRKEVAEQLSVLDKAEYVNKAPVLWKVAPEQGKIEDLAIGKDKVVFSTLKAMFKGEDNEQVKELVKGDDSDKPKWLTKVKDKLLWITPQEKSFKGMNLADDSALEKKSFDPGGEIIAIGVYDSNVYLFDSNESQVRQYSYAGNGLNFQKLWLTSNLKEELGEDKVVDMAIDGQIFLYTEKGRIIKLSGGKKVASDWEEPAMVPRGNRVRIVTKPSFKYLYVLDPRHNRIVIYNKEDGKLKGQVQNDALKQAVDFDVDETKKEVYFADSTAVFKLNFEL